MIKINDDRSQTELQLAEIEKNIKELRIRYEQYFAGIEKRAPFKEREALQQLLRRLNQRTIVQTELRYRFQTLSSRFHSYQGMWDRVQREMDEGRYHRHKNSSPAPANTANSEVEKIFLDYQELCKNGQHICPDRLQLEQFIEKQRDNIRKKYGNVECVFQVVDNNGKPKITASLKR